MAALVLGAGPMTVAQAVAAERFSAPKPPHVSAPTTFHVPAMPAYPMPANFRPQYTMPAQPHAPKPATNQKTANPAASGSPGYMMEPANVPFHVSNRGFYNHYHNSYRFRLYPSHNRNNNLLSAQMKHLINLKADLDTLAQGQTAPSQKQKDLLQRDLMAVVEPTAPKPENEPVAQLTSSLADMVSRKRKLPLDTERLVYDLDVVMNSPLATPSEVTFAINHSQSLFHVPGAARSDLETITNRLKAVAMR
jgi:hypothetical protein